MKSVFPDYKPSGSTWFTYINNIQNFKVDEWSLKEPIEIQKFIDNYWDKVVIDIVVRVEEEILKYKDELLRIKNTQI